MGEGVIYRRKKCIHCPMLIQLKLKKSFSVNVLYISKIERNNSIHSSVAVVNYLLVPPIIPYYSASAKKMYISIFVSRNTNTKLKLE
jgi:hypothetical protein